MLFIFFFSKEIDAFLHRLISIPEINELLLFIFSVPWTREAYFAAKIVRSRKWTRFTCTGIGIRLQWSAIKANVTGNLTQKIMLKFLKRSQWFWWYDLKHQAMRKPRSHKKKRISRSAFAGFNYCTTWSHGSRHHKSPDTWNISTPITRNFLFAGTIEQRKKVEQRKESETDCQNPSNQMNNAKILNQYYFFSLAL